MEYLFMIVWIAIIFYSIAHSAKKAQTPKTLVQGKKPEDFDKSGDFSFEAILQQAYNRTLESKTKETTSYEGKSKEGYTKENTQVVYKSKETKPKKAKVSMEEISSLPSIKATKPLKPEKPKKEAKEAKDEEYKNASRIPHPLKTFLENPENARNAFIMGEIFKQKF